MFYVQYSLIARLAASTVLAVAILAVPPLLTVFVDGVGASAEAAPWPNKKSKYKKDKPLKRFKPVSTSFGRNYDKLDKAKEKEDWETFGKIIASMKSKYEKYNEGEKSTFLWREIEYLYQLEVAKGAKNPQYVSDYGPTIKNYEKLLTLHKFIRESEVKDILLALAGLYSTGGDTDRSNLKKALGYYHEWLGMVDEVKPERKYQIGAVHFALGEYDAAIAWTNEAVADSWAMGVVPKERYFETQKYIYNEKKQPSEVAEVLEQLVKYYSKKRYWEQLGVIYQQGVERPIDAMVVFDLLRMQGFLTKPSYIRVLAFAYNDQETPYNMAKLYEWGIEKGYLKAEAKNFKYLYYAYREAGEVKKGIEALERYNELESDGTMLNTLSDEYIKDQNYKKAAEVARKARTAKKPAKKPGESHYREGIALFYLKKFDSSLKAFKQAEKDPAIKKSVESWTSYVQYRIDDLNELKETSRRLNEALAEG